MGTPAPRMEFWFDVVCPFAYLASTRIAGMAAEVGAELVWRPILLGGVLRAHGGDSDPNEAMGDAKRAWVRRDMVAQARELGEPLAIPAAHPQRTVQAMRLLVAAPAEVVPALAAALYRAYWVDGRDINDRAVLEPIGVRFGVPIAALDDPEVKDRLRAVTAEAAERGVFGVPTVTVNGERFWGVDGLSFVPGALGLPRKAGRRLVFFHDVASPFSYLAHERIDGLVERTGAVLERRPILVGALFQRIGTPLVPMDTFSASKRAYYLEDLARLAARDRVPFRFPGVFPIRSVVANRVAIVEPAAASALYRAAWAEDRPVSDAEGVRAVLDAAGFDGAALVARAEDPAVKERLRQNTALAEAVGVCGVPSFQVDGGEVFWGQDRMDRVERALRGPPA